MAPIPLGLPKKAAPAVRSSLSALPNGRSEFGLTNLASPRVLHRSPFYPPEVRGSANAGDGLHASVINAVKVTETSTVSIELLRPGRARAPDSPFAFQALPIIQPGYDHAASDGMRIWRREGLKIPAKSLSPKVSGARDARVGVGRREITGWPKRANGDSCLSSWPGGCASSPKSRTQIHRRRTELK
jgi:hypothetical protein